MKFEFDPAKSKSSTEMHGIDFIQAQALWEDSYLLEIPARTVDESRLLVVGRIAGNHWAGVITYRAENIQIISVRRARDEEIELYEGYSI